MSYPKLLPVKHWHIGWKIEGIHLEACHVGPRQVDPFKVAQHSIVLIMDGQRTFISGHCHQIANLNIYLICCCLTLFSFKGIKYKYVMGPNFFWLNFNILISDDYMNIRTTFRARYYSLWLNYCLNKLGVVAYFILPQ